MTQQSTKNCFRLKGFTLFELLIVLSLISLLSVVGLTNLIASRKKFSVNKAAIQVTNVLDTARDFSIRNLENNYYGVEFSANTPHTIQLLCLSCSPSGQVLQTVTLGDDIALTDRPPGNRLIFQPITGRSAGPAVGQPYKLNNGPEDIVVESPDWQITITVPITGSIYASTIQKK